MGSLTVILLDIDHFKQYNDNYGHASGDLCLQFVASVLSSFTQNSYFRAVRYEGDEFVLVITGLSPDSITAKVEELRTSISAIQMPDSLRNETSVTVSIGVPFHQSWEPVFLETAVSEADHALYQAKQNGRNQAVLFNK